MNKLMLGLAATMAAGALGAGAAWSQTTAPSSPSTGTLAPTTTPGAPTTGTMPMTGARPMTGSSTTGTMPMTSPARPSTMAPSTATTTAPMTTPSTTGTAATSGNGNPAVATTRANAMSPAKGHNSFTMAQARKRLESNGFTNVSGLTKDRDGVWRGKGQKAGTATDVWLDYKGNAGGQ